jgi:hypothetical protein
VVKQKLVRVSFVVVLLLAPLTGCGGDDDDDDKEKAKPVEGTFVGKVRETKAFVAVVVSPAGGGQDQRKVEVYVSDGSRLSEWFPGSVRGEEFTARSDDRDAEAKGKVSERSVTGTIELPGGRTVRYEATQATATSGLYDLTVSSNGKLRGASAAGVGLTGEVTLPEPLTGEPGTGRLKLADGTRLKFDVATRSEGDPIRLKAGQLRLIVLPRGELTGAGKSRRTEDGASDFFVRSS